MAALCLRLQLLFIEESRGCRHGAEPQKCGRVVGAVSGPDHKGGGDPPPSTDPTFVARNNLLCQRQRRRRFCFSIRQGEIFLFDPMCLYSKYSEFRGEFKNG